MAQPREAARKVSMTRLSRTLRRSILPAVIMVLACSVALTAPSSAFAEASFTFTGRGYGHGIGMSQYGAKGQAEAGRTYDQILEHYYTGASVGSLGYTPGTSGETVMRVAIQANNTPKQYWTFRGNNAQLYVDWSNRGGAAYFQIPQGESYTFFVEGDVIKVRNQDSVLQKTFTGAEWVAVWERDLSAPRNAGVTQVMQASGPWGWSNVLYNGSIRLVKASATSAYAINHVYMEDYVKAVVPRESPASWHQEALKAQSVAARSYAYVSRKSSSSVYDVYCTTWSQVYNGWGVAVDGTNVRHDGDSLSDPAVSATGAGVMKYGDDVVQTFFHSTSGGHTDDIEKVWPAATPQPYFKGVADPWDSVSPLHTWGPYEYTSSYIRSKFLQSGISAAKVPAEIVAIKVTERTRGSEGRVLAMTLTGADGTVSTLRNEDGEISKVRNALALYDIWFYVNEHTVRIGGIDRYDTAVRISENTFDSAGAVVIASGRAYADALAASALAGSAGGPVLLTSKTSLPGSVADEIERLGATKAYVVGGTGVVEDSVLDQLRGIPSLSIGSNAVERVAGADRYETAQRIAQEVQSIEGASFDGRAIVVNGHRYADAVAASGLAFDRAIPILLVSSDGVPAPTQSAIESMTPSSCMVVGGTGVVPDAVGAQLGVSWGRIAGGADRYATANELAEYLVTHEGFGWSTTTIASGQSLVDALSGGPLAGRARGPMLFVKTKSAPNTVTGLLSLNKSAVDDCYILGGEGAVSDEVQDQIEAALD